MKLINEITILEKNSKFITYYYKVASINDIGFILDKLKKDHKKAKHIVYAYKINNQIKKYDDKEPKNSAGLPILNVIIKQNLDNILIIVARYFGGALLGKAKLARTYSNCASEVIKK